MVYLALVVGIGFIIAVWKDARKIRIGYLLSSASKEKEIVEKEIVEKEKVAVTDQTLFVTQEKSEFCKQCGIRIDSKSTKCPKCGKITV